MKDIQFVKWLPEWHGFHFIKSNPNLEPSAFHLIYKWSIYFEFWEIRKFMTLDEMNKSYYLWKKNSMDEIDEL
jgi:hypothetical protein